MSRRRSAVVHDPSIPEGNDSGGEPGDFIGMRYHEDGDAILSIQPLENSHDLGAGMRIELAGGFVGEQNFRFVDERACNRQPLLLSPRELRGQAALSSRQTN